MCTVYLSLFTISLFSVSLVSIHILCGFEHTNQFSFLLTYSISSSLCSSDMFGLFLTDFQHITNSKTKYIIFWNIKSYDAKLCAVCCVCLPCYRKKYTKFVGAVFCYFSFFMINNWFISYADVVCWSNLLFRTQCFKYYIRNVIYGSTHAKPENSLWLKNI